MADPFRQFIWRSGGSRGEKKLDSLVLLAFRRFPRLAGRGYGPRMSCVCAKLAGAAQSIFLKLLTRGSGAGEPGCVSARS